MTRQDVKEKLMRFNRIFKDTDQTYREVAHFFGLSDSAFWILYLLRESDRSYTQSSVCEEISLSRQTVHSALKNLQKEGYIVLKSEEGNRKNKRLCLTDQGSQLAEKTVDRVLEAELDALEQFSETELEQFLTLYAKYGQCFHREAERSLFSAGDRAGGAV